MARSNKPIVWGLFAAGGTISAFLVPVVMVILGRSVPFGILPVEVLSFERIHTVVSHPLGRLLMFGFVTLCLWHAAHRVRTTTHDLGIHNDQVTMIFCYGVAGLGTILALVFLLLL
jgi:fumarate reductase subunit D